MEEVFSNINSLDLTPDIESLIAEEQRTMEFMVAGRIITNRFVNPDDLLKVFQRIWA